MSRVRVHNFSVSLDGFGAGEAQGLETPFGHAGGRLVDWFVGTRTFRSMQGAPGGSAGVDDVFASGWGPGVGAEIMGRNKFGPQRGPWTDHDWTGWWGDDPVFHTPVFVLTHHPRPSIEMEGGTTFHFLDADLIDYLHVALVPIVLGRGERLWDGLESMEARFDVESVSAPGGTTHLTFDRKPRAAEDGDAG